MPFIILFVEFEHSMMIFFFFLLCFLLRLVCVFSLFMKKQSEEHLIKHIYSLLSDMLLEKVKDH